MSNSWRSLGQRGTVGLDHPYLFFWRLEFDGVRLSSVWMKRISEWSDLSSRLVFRVSYFFGASGLWNDGFGLGISPLISVSDK